MNGPTGFEALFLTLLTLAFPFYNWLVMLAAAEVRVEDEASLRRRRRWGMAKPQGAEESGAGTFTDGF